METIAVSEFRANIMKVLKDVEHGSNIDITSRGKVVAKLIPPDFTQKNARKKLEEISENAVLGDVISPIDTPWEVLSQ